MKIAVFTRCRVPLSVGIYRDHVIDAAEGGEVAFEAFSADDAVPPSADLIWDPTLAGTTRPHRRYLDVTIPVVTTVHGAAHFSLPLREVGTSLLRAAGQAYTRSRARRLWRRIGRRVAGVIAVSQYGKQEIVSAFEIEPAKVVAIHHGLDAGTFGLEGARHDHGRPYLLHVSEYQPKKNFARILRAHQSLDAATRPDLLAVVPGYTGPSAPGVYIRAEPERAEALAAMYRAATAFVFPSLHESFGMPIVEAMACGCPVITSDVTACPEIAGDAGVLVDPRSTEQIAEAMHRLYTDGDLRRTLVESSVRRARDFSWTASAAAHVELFGRVLRESQ